VSTGTSGATYAYTPAAGDIVEVQLTSNAICPLPAVATGNVSISVAPMVTPSVTITVSPNDTLCTAGVASYSVTAIAYAGTAPDFEWTVNGVNSGTGTSFSLSPATGDIVRCLMNSNQGCVTSAHVLSNPIKMRIEPPTSHTVTILATHTAVRPGMTNTYTALAPNAGAWATYQWFVNGVVIAGATNSTFVSNSPVAGQMINCAVISSNVCATPRTGMSNILILKSAVEVRNVTGTADITLLPNPTTGTFTIAGSLPTTSGEVKLEVVNMIGQVVHTQAETIQNSELNTSISLPSTLTNGAYLLRISGSEVSSVLRFMLNR
jgi:hypothetical protein